MMRDQMAKLPQSSKAISLIKPLLLSAPMAVSARHFALMNPDRLVLACRSRERGEAALRSKSTLHFPSVVLKIERVYQSFKARLVPKQQS